MLKADKTIAFTTFCDSRIQHWKIQKKNIEQSDKLTRTSIISHIIKEKVEKSMI